MQMFSFKASNAKDFDLHTKNKEEKLTKIWNQTVLIPGNGSKIWLGENRARNVSFWNQELKCVCFGFLDTSVIA